MSKTSRPWQGTTLAVFAVIEVVANISLGLLLLLAKDTVISFFQRMTGAIDFSMVSSNGVAVSGEIVSGGFIDMISSMSGVFALLFLAAGVFNIFISQGFLQGKRWVVVFMTILLALSFVGSLVYMIAAGPALLLKSFLNVLIVAFFLYLNLFCLMHKFYKK